jgi:transposase
MSEPVLGIDIAKQKFDAALLIGGKLKHKTCKNSTDGFETLFQWLRKQGVGCLHTCLEATGSYGDELALYLHDAGHTVSIVNPARIKGFAQSELLRAKNDKIDAGLIARFCLAMRPEPWAPPSVEIRVLQALVRRADALVSMRTQELNRLGTAASAVGPSIQEHIAYLNEQIEKIKQQIAGHIDGSPELKGKKALLHSIPGIGPATIAAILAEINIFERCDEVRKVVAFIGLAPKEALSGSSIKRKPRLCKIGHARLRKALYMPAVVSIRYNPVIVTFYSRLKSKGKNGKVIVCAIMRKLVHIIFGILKSGKPFDPNYKPHFA